MSEAYRPPRRALPPPRKRWWPLVLVLVIVLAVNVIVLRPFLFPSPRVATQPSVTPSSSPSSSGGSPSVSSATSGVSSASPAQPSTPLRTTTTKPPPRPKSLSQLSVGVVLIRGESGETTSNGSGMVLTADGLVVTNYHVVEGTTNLQVTVALTGERFPATVVGSDSSRDVALLSLVGAEELQPVVFDDDPVHVGDAVIQVGNSDGQGFLDQAPGQVLELNTTVQVEDEYSPTGYSELAGVGMTDAAARPGDSGGPMYDDEGEVIGMTTAGNPDNSGKSTDNQTFHLPWRLLISVVNSVRDGESRGPIRVGPRPFLGITLADGTNRVVTVEPGSPAAKAGMTKGAKITGINDQAVDGAKSLYQVMSNHSPGDRVLVHWTDAQGGNQVSQVLLVASAVN